MRLKELKHDFKYMLRRGKCWVDALKYQPQLNYFLRQELLILALPTVDWNTPLFQRPQHLALSLSRNGIKFVYTTMNLKYDRVNGFLEMSDNLIITDKWFLCLYYLNNWTLLLSTQQLITISDIKKLVSRHGKIIYDYVDEIHQDISGSKEMEDFISRRHQYIKETGCAELVLCVSKKLYCEMLNYYPKEKVLLIPNGVDYDHFQAKRDVNSIPQDLKNIVNSNKPIIGYYGAMANWIDYELVNHCALNHPEWQFTFIGIDYNGGLKKLNQNLNNIHFLGKKSYQELPQYGIWFDVALIPFIKGEIAKSTSPLKLYEYMALGKPVVVTEDLVECYEYKGVQVAKNLAHDFSEKIKKAINQSSDLAVIGELKRQAKRNTWDNRTKIIVDRLKLY